ncbi:tRNA (adenosine(37)-N6)-threonylcarbamoyltransferase complex transferase subunit TsaD [Anaplasmataceae bacterium AB001_6]|nr:tRNA (adenosine(37)-N6)-threonylcarbamoyltransferase complex transferase subunit TsaD [Anaplasmataceae bacterium AB001_6]
MSICALAIETSCDETAVAIINSDKKILSNKLVSQDHKKFGGVYPEHAARQHIILIQPLIHAAMEEAGISWDEIDIVAVTVGPGLVGGLIIGLMVAKSIAMTINKPLIAVNHLEAHILIPKMLYDLQFPFLTLLVSGGHTQLIYSKGVGNHQKIGETLDDAVGECFDKIAKMLGMPYPGGPIVEKYATKGNENKFHMPKPLIDKSKYNFSFSGLKTHVKLLIEKIDHLTEDVKQDICASFQKCIYEILLNRIENTICSILEDSFPINNLIITGGVAANRYIRNKIQSVIKAKYSLNVYFPPIDLCTDNAVMVAWAGIEKYLINPNCSNISVSPEPRMKL